MSAPPGRGRRPRPLHERSPSQNNSHAIRIVPYSPPRLSDASQLSQDPAASQPSTSATLSPPQSPRNPALSQRPPSFQLHLQPQQPSPGAGNEADKGSDSGASQRSKKRSIEDFIKGSAGSQGSALSSASSSAVLLVGAKDDVVSGTKPTSGVEEGPRSPRAPQAPAIHVRSPTLISPVNASEPAEPPSPRRRGQAGHEVEDDDEAEAAAAADAGRAAIPNQAPAPAMRPRSRTRNFVSLHSDNKTFSLVGGVRGTSGDGASGSGRGNFSGSAGQRRQSDVDSSVVSSSVGDSSILTSPPLSMSTLGTSSSHERLSDAFQSDVFSDDRAGSPSSSSRFSTGPSTACTIPDRGQHPPASPVRAIRGLPPLATPLGRGLADPLTPSHSPVLRPSATTQLAEDLIITPSSSSSPWNYRMQGGLRKVPKTPDLKHKQKTAIAQSHHSSERETAALSPLSEATTSSSGSTVTPVAAAARTSVIPEEESDAAEEEEEEKEEEQAVEEEEEETEEEQSPQEEALPALPLSRSVVPKDSFASTQTESTTSETTNYKVYGHSSPVHQSTDSFAAPSSNNSNVRLIGESSSAALPLDSSPFRPPGSSGSDVNYVLHGDPSPSPSTSLIRGPRPQFSQESLVVPPLQPLRKKSYEKFGYYKSRSRESLRRANSSKSLKSISSVIAAEAAQPFFVAPAFFSSSSAFPHSATTAGLSGSSGSNRAFGPSPQQLQQQQQQQPMIEAHPHQWSSQLSTVMSESEGGSEDGGSPSRLSHATGSGSPGGPRRGSTGWASSNHSRQMLSISSSLAAQLDEGRSQSRSHSQSLSDSLERPQPTHARGGNGHAGPSRTVRDQDEHGDGLTDLHDLSNHPSRSGLSAFFGSTSSSNDLSGSRNIHSSSSSRAGSFTSASLPTWARLYYGSGERRYLSAPSLSDLSEGGSRPGSAMRPDSTSPNGDHFPLSLYSSRRRVRDVLRRHSGASPSRPLSGEASMDIAALPPAEGVQVRPGLRKKTSSIWSPHLRMDRRASRYSIWDPPSVNWSAESGLLGRRNAQVVLFIVGFVFPLAWMIAAVLPLPADPRRQLADQEKSQGELGFPEAYRQRAGGADEVRFQSARWWRTLNRLMSIVGLIIIGVVIALVVVGVRQGWYQRA